MRNNRSKLVVFNYKGRLAYATEEEYQNKYTYMFTLLPEFRNFDEVYDYLTTICNYDNTIVDLTEEDDYDID